MKKNTQTKFEYFFVMNNRDESEKLAKQPHQQLVIYWRIADFHRLQ